MTIDKFTPTQNQPNLRAKSGKIIPVPKTSIKNLVPELSIIFFVAVYLLVIWATTNVIVNTKASMAAKP